MIPEMVTRRKTDQATENPVSSPATLIANESQYKSPDKVEKSIEIPTETEVVVEAIVTEKPKSPEKLSPSKKKVQSPAKKSTPKKNTGTPASSQSNSVDIDDPSSKISTPRTSTKPSPMKLFAVKRTPRKHQVYGDTPPPADAPLDRSTVTLRSLLNWVPVNKPPPRIRDINPNPPSSKIDSSIQLKSPTPSLVINKKQDELHIEDQDTSNEAIDPLAPQLCLDADGNIVLDEQSLRVEKPVDESNIARTHVAEEAGLYGTTYNSFRRKPIQRRGRKWTEKDTTRFYRALSTIGTDFYSMTKLFPDRSRSQLLKKFKREERLFPHLVDDALKNKRNYDITVFYTSESEEENYDKLTKEAIKAKRKSKSKRTSEPKLRSTCDISALIDEVLARHAATENDDDNNVEERGEQDDDEVVTDSDESEVEVIPLKRPRMNPKERVSLEKSNRVSLSDMIEKTAAEVAASDSISQ
nr:transcription factor TFIIIB component B'' [Hymenolepis microstoma]